MRKTFVIALVLMLAAQAAMAQSAAPVPDPPRRNTTKLLIGVGLLGLGALVTAKSNESTTVTSPIGSTETSSRSSSQLATGLAIAGVGGYLVWDSLRDHRDSSPNTRVVWKAGSHSAGVFLHRNW
jgi:hypothetical protein